MNYILDRFYNKDNMEIKINDMFQSHYKNNYRGCAFQENGYVGLLLKNGKRIETPFRWSTSKVPSGANLILGW